MQQLFLGNHYSHKYSMLVVMMVSSSCKGFQINSSKTLSKWKIRPECIKEDDGMKEQNLSLTLALASNFCSPKQGWIDQHERETFRMSFGQARQKWLHASSYPYRWLRKQIFKNQYTITLKQICKIHN